MLGLARTFCGRLTPTYIVLLQEANKGGKSATDTVVIPACFVTKLDEEVKVIPGETWSGLANRSVGVSGSRTLARIFGRNVLAPDQGSRWMAATARIPDAVRTVQVPSTTVPVAYRVREGVASDALVSHLRASLGAPATLPSAPSAEPELKLEAGVDPALGGSPTCPPGPPSTLAAWPYSVSDLATVMDRSVARFVQLGGARDKVGVVAVIDNGIDGIFTPAFPEEVFLINVLERAHPDDGVDQDGNGFADDVVGTNIYAGGEPVAFPGSPGVPTVAAPAHGSMMSSLALGGADYNTWLRQTALVRRVKIRVVSIVRHSVEASNHGNIDKYAMPTDSLGKAIDYAARDGVTILNLSVSTPVQLASVEDALYNRSNLLLVVAAGNERINLDQRSLYPASLSFLDAAYRGRVVTVASHNRQECLSAFSGRGRETVDLAAPGEAIVATELGGVQAIGEGTSQATALVSFVAGLLRSIGIDQARSIKDRLIASVDLDPAFVGLIRSEGRLDVAKALDIYEDVLELKSGGPRLIGHLASFPTTDSVCSDLIGDTRKVLKLSQRVDGGDPTQVRLLVRNNDDRERMDVLYCKPSVAPISLQTISGAPVAFHWADVADLVLAV